VRIREFITTHKELAGKLYELENHIKEHDEQIQAIFEAIQQLIASPEKKRNKIGFEVNEDGIKYGRETRK
jgi:hypothetical protein